MALWRATAVLIWLALLVAPALAQKKYAFVVGIDKYDNLAADKQLQKAVGDAKAISEVLTSMGFTVVTLPNVTRPVFNERWQTFLENIKPGDSAAFIFSGHGVEINGANYLLPRDVPRLRLGRDEQLKRESLALAEILADLRERRPGFSLIVLDACRDNPFAEGTKAIGGTKGLARVEPPDGTFIMYSAGAHQTALDRLSETDKTTTSVYTRTLLPLLKTPGLSLLDMADRLGEQVRDLAASISHKQTPAFYSGVIGGRRVCLAGCEVAVVVQPPVPQPSFNATAEAARICREVEGVSSLAMLAVLERQHKGTPAADCVAARIDEVKKTQAAKEATDKAGDDRQRLAMVQQQEADRAAKEATAKAAEAAKTKAAVEERQRLELLQQEASRKSAQEAAEAEAKRKASDAAAAKAVLEARTKRESEYASVDQPAKSTASPLAKPKEQDRATNSAKLAALPKIESPPSQRRFDGKWTFFWQATSSSCKVQTTSTVSTIANGVITNSEFGLQTGRVSSSGVVRTNFPSRLDGHIVSCKLTFRERHAVGTCEDRSCTARVTGKRD